MCAARVHSGVGQRKARADGSVVLHGSRGRFPIEDEENKRRREVDYCDQVQRQQVAVYNAEGEAIDLFGSRTVPPCCGANQYLGPEFQKKNCWTSSRSFSSASDVAEVHHARCGSWKG